MVAAHNQRADRLAEPAELDELDGPAVRRWARAALAALVAARDEIDRLNVYPIPDADTGTNLVRTLSSAVEALGAEPEPSLEAVCEGLADAALRGACGNSGTILAQLLRGLADAAQDRESLGPKELSAALARSAGLARTALVRPVEGTILSVADAVAAGALRAADGGGDLAAVTRAGARAAAAALAATPGQLTALGGRVDAGGRGLQLVVEALAAVVAGVEGAGDSPLGPDDPGEQPGAIPAPESGSGSPSHEVMYLLDTSAVGEETGRIAGLRAALDQLGDSVLVVGGRGLWQVHAHVDDVGAALEAGLAAGRPHQVRIVAFAQASGRRSPRPDGRTVVVTADGPGLVDLLQRAGGTVLPDPPEEDALVDLLRSAAPALVVVVPGSPEALDRVERLTDTHRALRVVRSRSVVQVIAALAVHDPSREAEADLLAMSTAAAGCRTGLVEVAEGDGVTSVGVCHAGDVLGHVDGDVALIGDDIERVAAGVLDLLLGGGGELVTLVAGRPAAAGLATRVAAATRRRRPDIDVTTYDGGQPASYLLVGVE